MKNKELFQIRLGLNEVAMLKGAKFAYAVVKNDRLIAAEIEALQKGINTEEEKELAAKEREVYKKFCNKNESGEPIPTAAGNFDIPEEHKIECEKEMNALKEENKEAFEAREKAFKEYNELLDEDCSLELFKIPENYLPENITGAQIDQIFEIIE